MTSQSSTKCAIWLRVSTTDQDTTNQKLQLWEWAQRRGFEVTCEYVLDGASAWTGKHRPELDKALNDARLGKFQVLLVWALDRLSREGVEETLSIMRRFKERGCTVSSLQEPWTDQAYGPAGELLMSIMSWVAQQESVRRSERIKAGLERRRLEGKPVGRQVGAVDRKPRRKAGYFARAERERVA